MKKLKLHKSVKMNIAVSKDGDIALLNKVRDNGWEPMDIFRAGLWTLQNSKKKKDL